MKQSKKVPTSEVLKQAGTDFCENTSLHGFSYWVSDGKNHNAQRTYLFIKMYLFSTANIPEKAFWVTIVILGLIAGSYLLNEAVDEWVNNPTGKVIGSSNQHHCGNSCKIQVESSGPRFHGFIWS